MAKISFVGLDGAEKTHRLQTHRPFTLGRDPGNDIILRDPKVSRHHAEIVFERGFFVLHDLSSANGTFVNGKRVRIAPLTNGSRLKIGNTVGRFSEELPTESGADAEPLEQTPEPFPQPPESPLSAEPFPAPDAEPFPPAFEAADPFEQAVPPAVDLALDGAPTTQHEKIAIPADSETAPHQRLDLDTEEKKKPDGY